MRILWLTNIMLPEFAKALGLAALNQGGWLPSLAAALRRFAPEIELTIACSGHSTASVTLDGIDYVRLNCRGGREDAVRRLIARVKPDLIHVHGTEGEWANLSRQVFAGSPVVASLQGIISGSHPHYCGNLAASEVFSWANLPNMLLTRYWMTRAAGVWRGKMSLHEQKAFQNFDAFLGRTEWDRAWTKYLNPSAKYFHVGEILRAPFYRGGRSVSTIVPHTIYCGASFTYPLKGGHWLLRAVAALRRKFPDVQLRVANARKAERPRNLVSFIRQGEYHRYLSRLIRDFGLTKNVVLLPSLTAEEVAAELMCAEVFCLPSLCENSPNSLGEAMLMGCPCIATDVGGVQTILRNEEQGLLVPSGDPAILSHEIARLFENGELASKLSSVGQIDAVARYSPENVVAQLLMAYKGTIEK